MLGFVTNAFKSYGGMDCCSTRKPDQQYTTLQPNSVYLQQNQQQQQQQNQFDLDNHDVIQEDMNIKNENFDFNYDSNQVYSDPTPQQATKNFKKQLRDQKSSNNSNPHSSAYNSKKFDKIQKPAKGSSKQDVKNWNKDEEERLKEAIEMYSKDWEKVAAHVKTRNATQCEQKWSRIREPRAVQKWSDAEDDLIRQIMKDQPVDKKKIWGYISQQLQKQLNTTRNSKQVRERFINILDDNINKDPWTEVEDQIIIEKFLEYGPKWSLISTHLQGRPENKVKNHFYSYIRKNFNVPEIQQHQNAKVGKIPQTNGVNNKNAQTNNHVNNNNNQQMNNNNNGNGNHIQQEYYNGNHVNNNGNNYQQQQQNTFENTQMDQESSQNNNNNDDIMIKQEEPNFMQNSFEYQNGGGFENNNNNNFMPHQGFVPPQQNNTFNEPQSLFNPNRQFSFASSQDSHQGSYYSCYYSDCQNDDTVYFGKEKGKHIHKRKINFSLSNGSRRSINEQEVVVENEFKEIGNYEQKKAIDTLMVEIDRAKNGGEQDKLQNYYEQLQNICSNLGETLQHQQ